jgi:GDPmannose 4,6-dehydratase
MKKAIITGITGQDGSYLAELLMDKGYEVHGIMRRSSSFNTERVDHLYIDPHKKSNFKLHFADLSDSSSIGSLIREIQPDEFYNLGAQSHVRVSFDIPEYTSDIVGVGVLRCLEAIRKFSPHTKFYQASSSEMFGEVKETPQTENTPFNPRSPYGCAKVYGYFITKNYRESYNMHASNGILFNHESERRGETFVTRKITLAVAKIKFNLQDVLYLGNLDAKRDWGHAKDYVNAMYLMLQQEKGDDFVVATNETHSVREFLEEAFKIAGIEIKSNGKKGIEEEYVRVDNGAVVVKIDPKYYRPAEVDLLLGDPSKTKKILNWEPKIKFKELVKLMVDSDLAKVEKEYYGLCGKDGNRT